MYRYSFCSSLQHFCLPYLYSPASSPLCKKDRCKASHLRETRECLQFPRCSARHSACLTCIHDCSAYRFKRSLQGHCTWLPTVSKVLCKHSACLHYTLELSAYSRALAHCFKSSLQSTSPKMEIILKYWNTEYCNCLIQFFKVPLAFCLPRLHSQVFSCSAYSFKRSLQGPLS